MRLNPLLNCVAAAALLVWAGTAQAAIIEGNDVGSIRTFVDTTTGTVWADLDNHLMFTGTGFVFRYTDRNHYMAALVAAGFNWATTAEVTALVGTVPLTTTAQYDALGGVMGSLSFGETTTLDGYTDDGGGFTYRVYGAPDYAAGTAQWQGTGSGTLPTGLNDSGLWAYLAAPAPAPGASVPLPGTLALAGLGLAAVAGRRRAKA